MTTHTETTKSTRGHTLAKSAVAMTATAVKTKQAKADKTKQAKADKPKVEAEPTTDAPKVRRSKVPAKYKEKYAKNNGGCGDDMHRELTAATTAPNADGRLTLDWPALQAIAKQNGIDAAKYEGYNNGMKRMNIGNKLRGLLGAGTDVKIGKFTFKAEDAKAAGDK